MQAHHGCHQELQLQGKQATDIHLEVQIHQANLVPAKVEQEELEAGAKEEVETTMIHHQEHPEARLIKEDNPEDPQQLRATALGRRISTSHLGTQPIGSSQ